MYQEISNTETIELFGQPRLQSHPSWLYQSQRGRSWMEEGYSEFPQSSRPEMEKVLNVKVTKTRGIRFASSLERI